MGDAALYFTDADASAVGLDDVAAEQAFDVYGHTAYGEVPILLASRLRPHAAPDVSFAGYLFDEEAGLCLVRNRTYQEKLGGWLQREPMGFVDGPEQTPMIEQ